jgi:hypothetical protein
VSDQSKKRRLIWLDQPTAAAFDAITDQLELELGFRPNNPQVLRYLISKCGNQPTTP